MHNPLHIAIVVASMRNGGTERAMLNLANCLSKKDLRIDLVLINNEGEYLSRVSENVHLIDLKSKNSFTSFLEMRSYLRKQNPDIVIAAQDHVEAMVLVARAISGKRIPVILSEQSIVSINLFGGHSLKHFLLMKIAKQIFHKADYVAAVSVGVADDFKKVFKRIGEKVCVIYSSVDINEINLLKTSPVIHPFLQQNDVPVIVSAGRLSETKDFPTLLKAFHLVRKKRNLKLIILGDGIEKSNLQRMIEELHLTEDVSLAGYCENPFAFMSRASLFVLPSKLEGLSLVLIEAMACGCPVVSTDCPSGPKEILENGKYGKLVPMSNPVAMAEAIEEALQSTINKEILLTRAKDFSVENIAEQYLSLIEKIISSRKIVA